MKLSCKYHKTYNSILVFRNITCHLTFSDCVKIDVLSVRSRHGGRILRTNETMSALSILLLLLLIYTGAVRI